MNILSDFEKLYYHPDLQSEKNKNIIISAHKDRVWYFVIQKKQDGYIILTYGNISWVYTESLEYLYIDRLGKTIEVKCKQIHWLYYMLSTKESLEHWDFLIFQPWFFIEKDKIHGPYLDNIIGIWVAEQIKNKYPNIQVLQAIDEEASLDYTPQINECETAIIIDTIWQDYMVEPINFDTIYIASQTSFTKLDIYHSDNTKSLELQVWFKLEPDIIQARKKFFLLCPIQWGHIAKSSVKMSTLQKILSIVENIINEQWI